MKRVIILLFVLYTLISCATTRRVVEVPVEVVKKEYIYDTKIDSIYIKDSIDRSVRNDTVYLYKEHTVYKYLYRTDTILRVDSIPKIITVETIKEVKTNYLRWYQKTLIWIGIISLLIIIGYLLVKLKFK